METFPIQLDSTISSIPWGLIAPHEAQAALNHSGQTLEQLAKRGGVMVEEALAIIEDRPWRRMPMTAATLQLKGYVHEFLGIVDEETLFPRGFVTADPQQAIGSADRQQAAILETFTGTDRASVLDRLSVGAALVVRLRASGKVERHYCNQLEGIFKIVSAYVESIK